MTWSLAIYIIELSGLTVIHDFTTLLSSSGILFISRHSHPTLNPFIPWNSKKSAASSNS
jgi:hypothetical protein